MSSILASMLAFGRLGALRARDVAVLLAVVSASIVAVAPSVPAAASMAPACDGTWQAASVPTGKASDVVLRAVSADSASDAWVVGNSTSGRAFTAHWDGGVWAPVPVHKVNGNATLQSVAAVSPSDAWAVGFRRAHNGQILTLVAHWDGASWSRVPAPSPSRRANQLYGVAATGGNAWAVGTASENKVPFLTRTLVLRWDGSSWTVVPSPNLDRRTGENALAAVSGGDASSSWAAGLTGDPTDRGLLLRWDGTRWTDLRRLPALGFPSSLFALDAPESRRILAVGTLDDGSGQRMFSLRSVSGGWDVGAPPNPAGRMGTLHGVAWDSKSSAWAVGQADVVSGSVDSTTLVERWDGTAWSVVASPNPEAGSDILTGVAGVGGTMFASGYGRAGSRFVPFVELYC